MRRKMEWKHRCEDGVKREVRVEISHASMKWQFKRKDEPRWDYDSIPTAADWDALEEVIDRRAARGKALGLQEAVRKMRAEAGV